jgi:hypothetical protein
MDVGTHINGSCATSLIILYAVFAQVHLSVTAIDDS